ncbi:MAG: hypothetical protein LBU21_03935 [Treponema sp.]|jgi:hypothetical protein|nr:hypothetical protein [Treponema sp.]
MEKAEGGIRPKDDPAGRGEERKPGPPPGDGAEEMVFYYSRARRLEKASEAVRKLNDPNSEKPSNIFRTLVATKPRAMLLAMILCLSALIVLLSFLVNLDEGHLLGGNRITVSAMTFPDTTYIAVKKTAGREQSYTGTVDLAVTIPLKPEEADRGAEAPVALQRLFFTVKPEEDFRFSVPFEAPEILIVMQAEQERISLRVKPE